MNFNIEGVYALKIPVITMFMNAELEIKGHNIITRSGEAFFLYRCVDDSIIQSLGHIAIGNGTITPRRSDRKLGNESKRKKAVTRVDADKKQIILTASFTASEIQETSEIGVFTKNKEGTDVLISHDIYNKIDPSVFSGVTGDIIVEYIYQFTTGFQKTSWATYDETKNIYYSFEENTIIHVFENNMGYKQASSLNELETIEGSFYQDFENKLLYIKPYGDLTTSDIIVQV